MRRYESRDVLSNIMNRSVGVLKVLFVRELVPAVDGCIDYCESHPWASHGIGCDFNSPNRQKAGIRIVACPLQRLLQAEYQNMTSRAMTTAEAPQDLKTSNSTMSRDEYFKILRSKHTTSTKENHTEVIAEHCRMKLNLVYISNIERKKAEAELKLAKDEINEAGEDFERKRAWDWTMEESSAWDQRRAQKSRNREEAGFAGRYLIRIISHLDYTQTAEKAYRKNISSFKPDLKEYQKAREDALAKGQLQQIGGEEMIAVDQDRRFYADANSLGITDHKPSKEALDRLVEETKKREAEREAKRRKKRGDDDSDVSYINQRNKVFNKKLERFYDPYTRETREAFERGSGI
jgi:pre-mRNA-splicing factor SYF2